MFLSYLSLVLQIFLPDLVVIIEARLFPLRDSLGCHILVSERLKSGIVSWEKISSATSWTDLSHGLASLSSASEEVGPGPSRVEVLVLHLSSCSPH